MSSIHGTSECACLGVLCPAPWPLILWVCPAVLHLQRLLEELGWIDQEHIEEDVLTELQRMVYDADIGGDPGALGASEQCIAGFCSMDCEHDPWGSVRRQQKHS